MGYAHGDMFISQLKLAVEKKVPVKSCFCVNIVVIIITIQKVCLSIAKRRRRHVIQIRQQSVIGIDWLDESFKWLW
jgi:hypothetical protein